MLIALIITDAQRHKSIGEYARWEYLLLFVEMIRSGSSVLAFPVSAVLQNLAGGNHGLRRVEEAVFHSPPCIYQEAY